MNSIAEKYIDRAKEIRAGQNQAAVQAMIDYVDVEDAAEALAIRINQVRSNSVTTDSVYDALSEQLLNESGKFKRHDMKEYFFYASFYASDMEIRTAFNGVIQKYAMFRIEEFIASFKQSYQPTAEE